MAVVAPTLSTLANLLDNAMKYNLNAIENKLEFFINSQKKKTS